MRSLVVKSCDLEYSGRVFVRGEIHSFYFVVPSDITGASVREDVALRSEPQKYPIAHLEFMACDLCIKGGVS